jgi:fatty acid amide hydrolase 2
MASGASLIGIGSDIAGSLRLPAHCCGIWGHKPSPRVVSCAGHYPDCKNRDEWDKVFTLGPMARYAADLKLLLSVIAEPGSKPELKLGETVDVKKIKVYYVEDPQCSLGNRVDTCVINALHRVVAHFDLVCDWRCAKVEMSLMKYCAELSYIRLLDVDDIENLFEGKGEGSYTELFHFLGGQSNHELTTILYGVLRRNLHLIPPKSINKVYRYLDKLRNDLIKMLGNDGVFIMATSPSEASWHGDSIRKLFNCGYLSIFNALGLPVTNCPIGMSRNGLPLGIQVVASPNLDRLTLSVAEEVERAFGGWNFS